eukprot:12233820-Alexandrium_andersonii.AAC.1
MSECPRAGAQDVFEPPGLPDAAPSGLAGPWNGSMHRHPPNSDESPSQGIKRFRPLDLPMLRGAVWPCAESRPVAPSIRP